MGPVQEDLNPNLLENMIRQRKLMGAFTGGLPPEAQPQPPQPDLTVHVHHALGLPDSSSNNQPTVPDEPQTMQTGVSPGPAQSPTTAVPKIGPIDPNSANPEGSAYKQSLMNEPMRANYHPSKLRRVLSTIAGMGVGAFQGPDVGHNVLTGLRDAPFNSQHQDWAQYSGNKEKLANEEAASNTTAGKQALTQAQINEQNSLASLHGGELNNKVRELKLMRNTPDEVKQDKIDEAQGHLKVDTREAKMLDGTIKHLVQRNGLFYDPTTNARVDRSAIEDISDEGKSLKETKDARIPGNLGQSIKIKKIIAAGVGNKTDDGTTVDQPTFDAAKELDSKLAKGEEPAGAFARIITDRNKERVAAGKSPLTSDEEESLQMKLLTAQKPPAGTVMLEPTNTGYKPVLAKPGGPEIPKNVQTTSGVNQENTDTAPTRQMAETAPHVISLLDKIDKEIDENVKSLGPAAGRWNEFMTGKVGAQDPKFAALRTNVALAKTLIMRMHLGSRGGQGMYEHFNNMLDLAGSDPENLKAATGAIRDYATDVAKGSHGSSNTPTQATKRYNPATGQIEDVK